MNKRLKAAALIIAVFLTLSLSGCRTEKDEPSDPAPAQSLTERSQNAQNARFTFTLTEFTEKVNAVLGRITLETEAVTLDSERWELISKNMVDDSNMAYSSYRYKAGTVTLTASVENESKKVMSAGCGCAKELFDDEEYRTPVTAMASLVALTAGGYAEDQLPFFSKLYTSLFDKGGGERNYNGVVYGVIVDDDDNAVLFTVMASEDTKS